MEENKGNEKFKAVQNPEAYKVSYKIDNSEKKKSGFGRTVLVPFFSGVVG